MEISSQVTIFTSIILALTQNLVSIKVKRNQVDFTIRRRTSIERNSRMDRKLIGTRNTSNDKRIKRTSKDSRNRLINTVTLKKRKSGLEAILAKKKSSLRSTTTEKQVTNSRIGLVDLLRTLTTSIMTKTRCSTNSNMPNGNRKKRKCIKSTNQNQIPIFISKTEVSMLGQTCLQVIICGPK